MTSLDVRRADSAGDSSPRDATKGDRGNWLRFFSFTNISVIYVGIALIIIFSIWAPETFPTWTTVRSVLNGSAIAGLMALALVVPLSARIFDLSIGNAMGLANMVVAWLLVDRAWGIAPAVIVTVLAGLAMGVFNGLVVVSARIDSFIGTLATGSLFATAVALISTQTISGPQLSGSFSKIATTSISGIQLPVFLALGVTIVLWFVQRYTVTGRRIYALGFNERGSVLVGIRTSRLKFATLLVSGTVAGIAGVFLASQVSSGTPGIGPPYLLNAYAAAFLGATQFGGRFNAWGTTLAVILLGIGTNGIFLVGGEPWAQSMFSGVVLLVALGASNLEQLIKARSWIRDKSRQVEPVGAASAVVGEGSLEGSSSDSDSAPAGERKAPPPSS
jgi:ribose transport system permease protein